MGGGRWEMGDGRWEVGDGRWEVGGGRREVAVFLPLNPIDRRSEVP